VFRDEGDHRFRDDRDQFIVSSGTVITMRLERFPQGGVALDITEGKMFLRFDLWERQLANQEIVHA
jgi:hypothetical protein